MTVEELRVALESLPQEAEVGAVFDGGHRLDNLTVYLAQSGAVLIGSRGDVVYDDDDRPEGAPLDKDEPYWKIP